ncbi:4'-phosphopantetheinyl transferase family protein [Methylomonas sp. TEB]|uniref:4'-phosphopantetheinyl transferase family protein n=1 Tax=Methylomonas sp. TEB TaxID=3398229 RepID=UPI0039F50B02
MTEDLDIWFEPLAVCEDDCRDYWFLLDGNERNKALRFVRDLDRMRYVVSHGKLRLILATYLQQAPEEIVFATQAHGKPFIVSDESHGIKFNLAHSGDYLAVGVVRGYDIGVDIEAWTDCIDYEAVVGLSFSDAERRFWRTLPAEQKQAFFYKLWARKESFVKSVGEGLALDISRVNPELAGSSRFLSLPAGYGLPESWCLIDLGLAEGLSGAVTVSAAYSPKIHYRRLEGEARLHPCSRIF